MNFFVILIILFVSKEKSFRFIVENTILLYDKYMYI